MIKATARFLIGGACLWAAASSAARAEEADGLTLSGSLRARYEAIGNQARPGFNRNEDLVNLRTTFFAGYRTGSLRFGLEIYDSRVFDENGRTPVSTGEVNALEPVQAYVAADIADAFGQGTALTLTGGRMMLNLGSRRLVAADDYRNTTSSYTGLRADVSAPHEIKATLIYTLPQLRLPDDPAGLRDADFKFDRESLDLVLWGGVVAKAHALGPATAELSYFHLGERDSPSTPTRDRSLDTVGGRVIVEPAAGHFDGEVEAFYQTGEISASTAPAAARQPVRANFVHVDAGYSFPIAWAPRVSIEYGRASGDKPGGAYGRFDTLFGMRRGDFSPSGLFTVIARSNLSSPGIRIEATPSKRLDWFASYRAYWLAADEDSFSSSTVRDPSGASGDFAGQQLDVRLRYWVVPQRLRFEFDGVLLARGRFLRDAPNATPGHWTRYGSFNLTASF